jgi:hypothetical protein
MRFVRPATRLLAAVGIVLVGLVGVAGMAAATTAAPYTDPNAVGYIGLCNQSGQQIASGNVNTTPFAWRAVSSEPPPAPYNNTDRSTILEAYLPIQVLPPGDWSGEQLTSDSKYSDAQAPMAAATAHDISLATFISDYPPEWDGFLQLRMYLGTEGKQAYTLHYPTLNIQVVGDTWTAVGGGPVNCKSGTAESLETVALGKGGTATSGVSPGPSAASGTHSAGAGAGAGAGGASHPSASSQGGASRTGGPSTATNAQSGTAVVSGTHGSSDGPVLAVFIAVIVVLIAAIGYVVTKRRRFASSRSLTGSQADEEAARGRYS